MRESFILLSINTWFRSILVCSLCTVFAACTIGQSIQQHSVKPPETASAQPEAAPLVYYTGVDQLTVYNEPRSSASQLTRLPLHQKVYRYKTERGYAYIKVETSGVTGWVDNARLIWRLPSQQQKTAATTEGRDIKSTQEVPVEKGKSPTPTTVVEAAEPEPMPTVVEAPTEQEPSSPPPAPASASPTPSSPAAPSPRPISPSIFNPF